MRRSKNDHSSISSSEDVQFRTCVYRICDIGYIYIFVEWEDDASKDTNQLLLWMKGVDVLF